MPGRPGNTTPFVQISHKIQTRLRLRRLWFRTSFIPSHAWSRTKSCTPSVPRCISNIAIINEPPLYIRWKKLSMQYYLNLSSAAQIQHLMQCSVVNSNLPLIVNQSRSLRWAFESNLICMRLALNRKTSCRVPLLPLHHGFLITCLSTLTYTASIRRTLLQTSSEADFTTLQCRPVALVLSWWLDIQVSRHHMNIWSCRPLSMCRLCIK